MAATLRVRVIPRAKRNGIGGWRDGALVVRLTAPPVEGAANQLLVRALAKHVGVRPSDISLVTGERSREKVVRVEGLTQDELTKRLPAA